MITQYFACLSNAILVVLPFQISTSNNETAEILMICLYVVIYVVSVFNFIYSIYRSTNNSLPNFAHSVRDAAVGSFTKCQCIESSSDRKIICESKTQNSESMINNRSLDYQLLKYYFDLRSAKLELELRESILVCNNEQGSIYCTMVQTIRVTAKSKKILIVDDDNANRNLFSKLLQLRGHYCEHAQNGIIGLNMVRATLDMNTDDLYLRCYDFIFVDALMPVMNGISCTKAIRDLGFKGSIMGTTACIESYIHDALKKAGVNHIFVKPFKTSEIYAAIEA